MGDRAALVLYDAECGVCSRFAALLRQGGVRVAPIRSAAGDRELRDLSPAARDAGLHAVDAVGRRRSGPAALPLVCRALPGLAWTGRIVESAPAPFARGYSVVARHRGTLSRLLRLGACGMPASE